MIRRTFAAVRCLLGTGRPSDLDALIDANLSAFTDDTAAATRPAGEGVDVLGVDPVETQEYDSTFHRLISELVEGLAAVRAPLHDDDFAEWHRELAWTGDDA